MNSIRINVSKPYNIFIGEDIVKDIVERLDIKSNNIIIITDNIVKDLYYESLKKYFNKFSILNFTIESGEKSKRLEVVSKIYDFLINNKVSRSDTIVAFGGGVVGDIAGFVASTYQRGIKYIQIPTTFLSQIDSSVGGKTGINLENGKNMIGTFYHPSVVICDTKYLKTLKDSEFLNGLSEAIKYGLIRDKKILNLIDNIERNIEQVIYRCIEIKRDIVQEDEYDKNTRMLLNFGHTIGHSIESNFLYKKYSHGQAVAIGMYQIVKRDNKELSERIKDILIRNRLPYECEIDIDRLFNICCNDKKIDGDEISIVLLKDIGEGYIKKLRLKEFLNFLKGDSE